MPPFSSGPDENSSEITDEDQPSRAASQTLEWLAIDATSCPCGIHAPLSVDVQWPLTPTLPSAASPCAVRFAIRQAHRHTLTWRFTRTMDGGTPE